MMNFANTGNFTGVADTEISDKLCFKNSGNDTICFADNKTYLLDFWFTGCSACFKAFPQLEEIYNKYKSDTNIKIYSVNIPVKDDTENIAFEIIKERNYSFPVLIGINNIDSVLGIESYPRVFIIKNNKIRFKGLIELAEQNLSQE